jgi:hypothetical protein
MYSCSAADYRVILLVVEQAATAALICSTQPVDQIGTNLAILKHSWAQVETAKVEAEYARAASATTAHDIKEAKHALDVVFLLTAGYLVFIMQAGFAMVRPSLGRPVLTHWGDTRASLPSTQPVSGTNLCCRLPFSPCVTPGTLAASIAINTGSCQ